MRQLSNRLMFFKTLSARLHNGFLISYNNPVIRTITINRFRKFESFGSFEEKFFWSPFFFRAHMKIVSFFYENQMKKRYTFHPAQKHCFDFETSQVSTAQLKVVFHHYCKRKYQRNCFSKKCCYFFLNKDKQITRCLDFVKSVPLFKTSPFFPPKYRISLVFTISSEEDMYKSCFWSNLW